jgi:hypothetical protein
MSQQRQTWCHRDAHVLADGAKLDGKARSRKLT